MKTELRPKIVQEEQVDDGSFPTKADSPEEIWVLPVPMNPDNDVPEPTEDWSKEAPVFEDKSKQSEK